MFAYTRDVTCICVMYVQKYVVCSPCKQEVGDDVMVPDERWGAGVETQKNVRGEVGGWGRVPFNEPYAPSLSTIYNGA